MATTDAEQSGAGVSIEAFSKNPLGIIRKCGGAAIAVLDGHELAFFAVPTATYKSMLELIDDLQLAQIVRERRGMPTVAVQIDQLIAQAEKNVDELG